ncbi:MAG: hypothetical protein ACJ74H_04185 [Thermoanaerobaculia bacterium]
MRILATTALLLIIGASAGAATPAERRMHAARELQDTFDSSLVKGFELKFTVRGSGCDVLHVEGYTNLTDGMMQSLANGTLIYGRVLPGGVNQFAFGRGFRQVAYTNEEEPTFALFGEPRLTRKQVKQMRRCTDAMAAKLTTKSTPAKVPEAPRFEPLSWATATVGRRLYDGAYKHDATIVSVDRAEGVIRVRYVRSGSVEPKLLRAVAQFWYVRSSSTASVGR